MSASGEAAVVQLRSASKRYGNGENVVRALQSVDLDVYEGQFIALCGPSGSGKSTLLNICGLIDRIDEGSYHLRGEDVSRIPE